jgi:hypothetical protein
VTLAIDDVVLGDAGALTTAAGIAVAGLDVPDWRFGAAAGSFLPSTSRPTAYPAAPPPSSSTAVVTAS